MDVLGLNPPPCCHNSFSFITGFDIKIIQQITQTTRLHARCCYHCHYRYCCHYCHVDFVLFHNVAWYINFLFSCIHVNTTNPLNITCTLVATSMILRRSGCTWQEFWPCMIHWFVWLWVFRKPINVESKIQYRWISISGDQLPWVFKQMGSIIKGISSHKYTQTDELCS